MFFLGHYRFFLDRFIFKLLITSEVINLGGVVIADVVFVVEIILKWVLFLLHYFLDVHFLIPIITVWIFLFLHQDIRFWNLCLFGFLSNYQGTLLLLLGSWVVGLHSGKGKCFGVLDIVILIIAIDCISVSRNGVVVVGYIDIVICKFVVLKLRGGVDFVVVVSSSLGGMFRMILFVFLVSVFRQIFFVFDERAIIDHIFRFDFDGSYLALSVTHSLQFEFNITILITLLLF